jgi:hypothetical protein
MPRRRVVLTIARCVALAMLVFVCAWPTPTVASDPMCTASQAACDDCCAAYKAEQEEKGKRCDDYCYWEPNYCAFPLCM